MPRRASQSGFTLVELVVALAVVVTVFATIYGAAQLANKSISKAAKKTQAAFLLEEGIEAIRHIRDVGWNANIQPLVLSPSTYCLNFASDFSLAPGACGSLIDNLFSRTVVFQNICRDSSNNVVGATTNPIDGTSCTGGHVDANTKFVTLTVSWLGSSESMDFYLANLYRR